MTEMQQVMALFTFLFTILVALQLYQNRQIRQDIRDIRQDMRDMEGRLNARMDRMDDRSDRMDDRFDRVDARFDRVDDRFDRVDDKFDRVDADIKILINDVGELKGAAGISTSSREREPVGTGD